MYSQAGEPDEEDHHRDFTRTVRFLFATDTAKADEVEQLLERFRLEVLRADRTGPAIVGLRSEIEQRLRLVIARTERLAATDGRFGMLNASAGDQAHLKAGDRKSTRLNSSHRTISYAVFCLKKKTQRTHHHTR